MPSEAYSSRHSQRGQTILLVAVSMVSLLAMAALAIDVVTLYVARTEIQRSADAAALVGAKAIADSGLTSVRPGDGNLTDAKLLAQSMATAAVLALINATPAVNQVAGSQPTLVGGVPTYNFTLNNNPTITVTLQQANLPTFFARIFGQRSATTSATAMAEAYNPGNLPANFTPITPRCVKPWLVANTDPTNSGAPFVDPTTGTVLANLGALAAQSFELKANCHGGNPSCTPPNNTTMSVLASPLGVQYLPALVTPNLAVDSCPACADTTNNFGEGVACCNAATYSCGGTVANAFWDSSQNPEHGGLTSISATATECLIHASTDAPDVGQDKLEYPSGWPSGPPQMTAGTANPMKTLVVTTSSSIVTIPIIGVTGFGVNTGPVTVFGFLQAFVNQVDAAPNIGAINITVMNVVGCSQTPNLGIAPIVGGNGASPIPVRLITPP